MTGPEHYREAERLNATEPFCMCERTDCEHGRVMVARAQVHATLALAAAVGNNEAGRGQTVHESNAWYRVAGSKPPQNDDGMTPWENVAEVTR